MSKTGQLKSTKLLVFIARLFICNFSEGLNGHKYNTFRCLIVLALFKCPRVHYKKTIRNHRIQVYKSKRSWESLNSKILNTSFPQSTKTNILFIYPAKILHSNEKGNIHEHRENIWLRIILKLKIGIWLWSLWNGKRQSHWPSKYLEEQKVETCQKSKMWFIKWGSQHPSSWLSSYSFLLLSNREILFQQLGGKLIHRMENDVEFFLKMT